MFRRRPVAGAVSRRPAPLPDRRPLLGPGDLRRAPRHTRRRGRGGARHRAGDGEHADGARRPHRSRRGVAERVRSWGVWVECCVCGKWRAGAAGPHRGAPTRGGARIDGQDPVLPHRYHKPALVDGPRPPAAHDAPATRKLRDRAQAACGFAHPQGLRSRSTQRGRRGRNPERRLRHRVYERARSTPSPAVFDSVSGSCLSLAISVWRWRPASHPPGAPCVFP